MALIEITRIGNSIRIQDVQTPRTHQQLDFTCQAGRLTIFISSDGQSPTSDDSIAIYFGNRHLGNWRVEEFQTPSAATVEELLPLISGIADSVMSMTFDQVMQAITDASLPAGSYVFVSDICDDGAWHFCPSSTTISSEGQGTFLNCDENIEPLADWSRLNIAVEFDQNAVVGTFSVGDSVWSDANSWEGMIVSIGVGTMQVRTVSFISYPGDYPQPAFLIGNPGAQVMADTVTMPDSPYLPLSTSGGRWHRQSEGFTVDGDTLDIKINFDQLTMTGGIFPQKFVVGDTLTEGAWSGIVTELGDNYAKVHSNSALGTYPIVGNTVTNGTVSVTIQSIASAMNIGDAVSASSGFTGAVVYVDGLTVSMASYNFNPGYQYPLVGEVVTVSGPNAYEMTVSMHGDIGLSNGDVYVDYDATTSRFFHYQLVDVTLINTNNPSTCTTDVWQPLPFEIGFGYLPVSNQIVFDFFHTDSITGKGWLASRKDGRADIEYTFATDEGYFSFVRSNVMNYRWGKKEWNGIVSTGGYIASDACYLAAIEGLEVGYRGYAQFNECLGATLANAKVGARANAQVDIAEGITVYGLNVLQGVNYIAKTLTQNVYGNTVRFDDTDPRVLAFTPGNQMQAVIDITSDQLRGTSIGENINTGIALLPALLHCYYEIIVRMETTPGTIPYDTPPPTLDVAHIIDGQAVPIMTIDPGALLLSINLIDIFRGGYRTVPGAGLVLISSDGTPFTLGNGTVKIIIDYTRHYMA